MEKVKVTPKAKETKTPVKRVKKVKAPEVISYAMRMVIPTGQYANVQPEIVVKAGTLEEAHAYIAPHMDRLWKDYYMVSERPKKAKAEPAKTVYKKTPEPVATPATPEVKEAKPTPEVAPEPTVESPISSVALGKANQAVTSCLSPEALDLIIRQIAASTKLTAEDKASLLPVVESKSEELNDKE